MEESSVFRKKWLFIVGWLVILLGFYGWQIVRMGGIRANLNDIFFDLVCAFPLLLILWMAFFAQFVLPVRTFRDRQKIFDRLLIDLFGGHGPAIFVEDGNIRERPGETDKKGPGVVWLDSASAAVTRTPVAIKQVLGPGVHFLDRGEFIAGTIDLHTQIQSIGPKEEENPFPEKKDDQGEEEYRQIQDRRKMVSALTRDGIEVIPNISVIFRVDTGFPMENEPGSRFGYRTGITRKARLKEEEDKDAIRRAIIGQGINLNALPDSPRRRLAWNELPATLAIDAWREYVAKYTLDELFTPTQIVPPAPEKLPQPAEEEVDPLSQPIQVTTDRSAMQHSFVLLLREINILISRAINFLEEKKEATIPQKPKTPEPPAVPANTKREPELKTALYVINEMVRARLTQPEVDFIDETGKRGRDQVQSEEYRILKERGLNVQSASVSNLRLHPSIDDLLIKQWKATWLTNANAESEQINRKQDILEASAREQAQIKYAEIISREINELSEKKKTGVDEIVKTLLMRTRAVIRSGEHSEQLRRRMSVELQEIEEMINWAEGNGK